MAGLLTGALAIVDLALWLDAGCRLAQRALPATPTSVRLLAGAIFGASALLGWLLLLGAFGWIGFATIATGGVLAWAAARRFVARSPLPSAGRRLLVLLRSRHPARGLAAWLLLLVVAVSLGYGLLWPSADYDALSYHLPYTAAVVDRGTVPLLDTPFGDSAQAYQPKNDALLRAALVVVPGRERLLWTAAFGHLPLLLLSIYVAGRALGARRSAALWGAAVATASPLLVPGAPIPGQAAGAMVDLPFAGWWLAFAALALARGRAVGARWAAAGLAFGLAAGTKYTAVPFAPLALVVVAVAIVTTERRGRALSAWIAGALLTGAFFYARNWVLTGNPLYPVDVDVAGVHLFDGNYTTARMRDWVFNWSGLDQPPWLDRILLFVLQLTGAAPSAPGSRALSLASLAVPALLWLLGLLRSARQPRAWIVLLLAPAVVAICWWIVPFNYPRFALLAVALVGVATACAARPPMPGWVVPVLLAVHLTVCWPFELLPLLAYGGALAAILALHATGRHSATRLVRWIGPLVTVAVAALLWQPARPPWVASDTPWSSTFPACAAAIEGSGTVAYAGHNLPYPLRGEAGRKVVYVPLDGRTNVPFHQRAEEWKRADLPPAVMPEPGFDRRLQDPAAWLTALQSEGVRWLFVARLRGQQLLQIRHDERGFPIESAWARAAAPALELVHASDDCELYRVSPGPPTNPLPPAIERREPDAFWLLSRPNDLLKWYPRGAIEIASPKYERMRKHAP